VIKHVSATWHWPKYPSHPLDIVVWALTVSPSPCNTVTCLFYQMLTDCIVHLLLRQPSGVSPNLEVNISPEVLVVTLWVFDATNEGVRLSGSSYAEPSKKMFGVLIYLFVGTTHRAPGRGVSSNSPFYLPFILTREICFCHYDLSI
jgi:hypothetical protein